MKFILLFFILFFSVFADSRKDCFDQYNLGKITKKELMKCSNIKDSGYLKVSKVDIPISKVSANNNFVINGVGLSKKFDIFSISVSDIPEKNKVKVSFNYRYSEGSSIVHWKNSLIKSNCYVFETTFRKYPSYGSILGSALDVDLRSSSQDIYIKRRSTDYGAFVACEIKFDNLEYAARSHYFSINNTPNFVEK